MSGGYMDYMIERKDLLLLVCFTVDAINTLISFPLIMWNGPKWLLESTDPASKEKLEGDHQNKLSKKICDLSDTERKSFRILWEIFTVAYEGYFGFTISTFFCLFQCPESRPYFGYSLFALYLYKAKSFLLTDTLGSASVKDSTQGTAKLYTILFFYWPCYGGYCLLHMLEKFGGF
jgi:hypothetical protein